MSAPILNLDAGPKTTKAERRNGPRLFTILMVVVALIGVVLAWRMTTLQGLPDVPALFDRSEAVVAIPDDQNAYTWYRRATEIFSGAELYPMTVYTDMSVITDVERRSLEANRGALDIWLEGTKRDHALCFQARDGSYDTVLGIDQKLRSLGQLAHLHAFLLRSHGDHAAAWTWLRAALRSGRHVGTNGFLMQRRLGIGFYGGSAKQAMLWADDPGVDARLLRQALDDILTIDTMTPLGSTTVRYEYFAVMNTLDDWQSREGMRHFAMFEDDSLSGKLKRRLDSTLALAAREPERSRRVLRLIFSRWLAASDLPREEREKRVISVGKLTLFQPSPGSPDTLSPQELERWIDSSHYTKPVLEHWSLLNTAINADEINRARLIVHFAEQLYLRERGKPADRPEQLVGPYLKSLPTAYEPSPESKSPGPSR